MTEDGSVIAGNPEDNLEPQNNPPAGNENWAGADYQELVTAKGWSGPDDVLQSYVNLEKAVGADKVALPAADTDILAWDGWEKLGVPVDAANYEMKAPEGYNAYDQTLADDMRGLFHEAKLTPAQATMLHDRFVERQMGQTQSAINQGTQQVETWDREVREKYGDAYNERINAAKQAVAQFGGDDLAQWLTDTGAGNHPVVIDAFAQAGMALGQTGQFKDGPPAGFGITPADAKDQIAALRANPALTDKTHPEHAVLNQKLTDLYQAAHPDDGTGSNVVATVG